MDFQRKMLLGLLDSLKANVRARFRNHPYSSGSLSYETLNETIKAKKVTWEEGWQGTTDEIFTFKEKIEAVDTGKE